MHKSEKIKLLNEVVNAAGLQPWDYDVNSTHEDIDNALGFCIATIDILESYKSKIDEALEVKEIDLNYSIKDESTCNN